MKFIPILFLLAFLAGCNDSAYNSISGAPHYWETHYSNCGRNTPADRKAECGISD